MLPVLFKSFLVCMLYSKYSAHQRIKQVLTGLDRGVLISAGAAIIAYTFYDVLHLASGYINFCRV